MDFHHWITWLHRLVQSGPDLKMETNGFTWTQEKMALRLARTLVVKCEQKFEIKFVPLKIFAWAKQLKQKCAEAQQSQMSARSKLANVIKTVSGLFIGSILITKHFLSNSRPECWLYVSSNDFMVNQNCLVDLKWPWLYSNEIRLHSAIGRMFQWSLKMSIRS